MTSPRETRERPMNSPRTVQGQPTDDLFEESLWNFHGNIYPRTVCGQPTDSPQPAYRLTMDSSRTVRGQSMDSSRTAHAPSTEKSRTDHRQSTGGPRKVCGESMGSSPTVCLNDHYGIFIAIHIRGQSIGSLDSTRTVRGQSIFGQLVRRTNSQSLDSLYVARTARGQPMDSPRTAYRQPAGSPCTAHG